MLPDTLKHLAQSGAHLIVDARAVSLHDLKALAMQAEVAGGTLTVRNARHILSDTLKQLAAAHGKALVLDLT